MQWLDPFHSALVLVTLFGCGLMSGVFFAFSTFIMKALSRLSYAEGIRAMQSINVTVLNRSFLGVFSGTAVLCVVLLTWSLLQWRQTGAGYLMAASLFYFFGSFIVTGIFNVPKNEILAKVDVLDVDAKNIWLNYIATWTKWNHIRTMTSLSAAVCFGVGLYKYMYKYMY